MSGDNVLRIVLECCWLVGEMYKYKRNCFL